MGIFLRHSWNVKPPCWGSPADVQYAIKINAEKIYQVDPDSIVLAMPLFWGLPLLDYSGYNNHGTNHGATYKDGSLSFDGNNDYEKVKNSQSLQISSAITIAGWYYPTSDDIITTDIAHLVSKWESYVLRLGDPDKPVGYRGFGITIVDGTTSYDKFVGTFPALNTWHYVTGVYDGSELKIYINAAEQGSATSHSGNIDTNTNLLYLGQYQGSGFNYPGCQKELIISNVAHTANQIALFHDLPYGLYQPVQRPIWLIPAAATTSPPTTLAPTTPSPTTVAPTTPSPTTVSPTTIAPTTSPPTSLPPTTSPPTSLAPTTPSPTTLPPTTIAPTTSAPTTIAPTTTAPTTLPPTTPSPTTLPPTLPPTTVAPTTLPPTTLAPTTLAPTTAAPTTLAPTTLAPTSLPPTSLAPTSLAPTTLPPTTLAPTTTVPTSLPPTTLGPTTLPPTTLAPTTALPTTLQPTTLGPTTIAPTTLPPTTLVPTTDIPEAICIKTCDSLITSEIICYAPITEEILCYGNLC